MKLGVHIGYWGLGISSEDQLKLVQEAERLGYDSVWAAEAYGSDTATVLGWLAGQTSSIASRVRTGRQSIVRRRSPRSRLEVLRFLPISCEPPRAQPVPAASAAQRFRYVPAWQRTPPAERKLAHEARRSHRILGPWH